MLEESLPASCMMPSMSGVSPAEDRFHLLYSLLGLFHVMHQVGQLVADLLRNHAW